MTRSSAQAGSPGIRIGSLGTRRVGPVPGHPAADEVEVAPVRPLLLRAQPVDAPQRLRLLERVGPVLDQVGRQQQPGRQVEQLLEGPRQQVVVAAVEHDDRGALRGHEPAPAGQHLVGELALPHQPPLPRRGVALEHRAQEVLERQGDPGLEPLLPVGGEQLVVAAGDVEEVDVVGTEVGQDPLDHGVVAAGEVLVAQDPARLGARPQLGHQPFPELDPGLGPAQRSTAAQDRPAGLDRALVGPGVEDAELGQLLARVVQRLLDRGRAGLLRADVQQQAALGDRGDGGSAHASSWSVKNAASTRSPACPSCRALNRWLNCSMSAA